MADFNKSFKKLILSEGGYVDDPDDAGGETYLGITRKNHPNANMWKYIDDVKNKYGTKNITSRLKRYTIITDEARSIYKNKYWDCMMLDHIPSQKIAHQLFDDAVNRGVSSAIRIAEHIMGMTTTGIFSDELFYNLCRYGKNK